MNSISNRFFGGQEGSAGALPLFVFCLFIFFYGLEGALFEPTEGRNAEIAREILITYDWVTPHGNFIPVLDKPIFFHWLIAICHKLFGVSEGPARLPYTLAGLGTIATCFTILPQFLLLERPLACSGLLYQALGFIDLIE